jgi:hypothetical protein
VFATHDDPGYCQAIPCVNRVSLAALVNSVPGIKSGSMSIAVLGAGAMGCLFGGRLAEVGDRVILIDRAASGSTGPQDRWKPQQSLQSRLAATVFLEIRGAICTIALCSRSPR